MELNDGTLHIASFLTFTIGILVLFIGKRINDAVGFLRGFRWHFHGVHAYRYGASHLAFIIVPLVCAFFIEPINAMLIPIFRNNF